MTRTPPARPSTARTLFVAAFANLLAPFPVFLLGALAVFVRRELDLSESAFGLTVSTFFAVSAIGSVPGGRLGERVGAFRAITVAACVAAVGMAGVALLTPTLWHLLAWLALMGVANAVFQPAANLAIARRVSAGRQGLAFGIKQSTGPGAALLAGLAVPMIGLTVGWRWAFGGMAVVCALFALGVQRATGPRGAGRDRSARISVGARPLAALTLTTAFGAASLNSVAAFYVDSAVAQHGLGAGAAGLWLALGGTFGIAGRIGAGWFADRVGRRHMVLVSSMLAAGGVGVALLAAASGPALRALATVLAFAAGWGWSGVFNFVMVRQNDLAPAAATSVTNAGLFVGGMVGPTVFGLLVQHLSYPVAWGAAGLWMVVAGGLVLLARHLLRAERRRGAA